MIQVLADADNLSAPRLAALLRTVPLDEAELVAAGTRGRWQRCAGRPARGGWQQADAVLAGAYRRGRDPLVLASGDGDFALLAAGHGGPVLVVSDRPASHLRRAGTVVDPVTDGLDALRRWFDAVLQG